MVGDLQFAFSAVALVGIDLAKEVLASKDGPSFLAMAKRRGATMTDGTPVLGDLVVFDRVRGKEPASLVGVVVSSRRDATVEFIYLQRGVVRRGYMNLRRPTAKRDRSGRVLNTHIRGNDGKDPRGTRYLAGELFASFVRLERLAR